MANRQRAEARRKAAAKAARQKEGGNSNALWIGVIAVVAVALAALIVVVAGGGDETASTTSDSSTEVTSAFPTSQPVTITGDALPQYSPEAATDEGVGATAPTVKGLTFGGDEITLDSADGAYMVVFLAHWCPHCNAEVPRLIDWKKSGAVPADLRVIGVATAVAQDAPNFPPAEWFNNKGWPWPVLVDQSAGEGVAGEVAKAYGASGWPYFVIVGADGKVKVRVSGEVEASELEQIVSAALAS